MSDFIRKINLVPASGVKFERVDWLIDNWIPRRSLTLLAGREGLGKSTIACDFAARATRGELDNNTVMNVIYLNTEDSRSITVAPRLKAAGADMERVFFLDVTLQYDDGAARGALDLPQDFRLLEDQIEQHNIGLVILDAAKSAMSGKIDGNRDDSVRQFLDPIAAIADRTDCAFIGLVHFGKQKSADSGQLILGSIAWSQVARSVLSVALDDESGRLLVTNTKGNLASKTVTHEAEIVTAEIAAGNDVLEIGRIQWHGESTRDARDLLRDSDDDGDDRSEVEAVVLDYLESVGGSAPAGDVLKVTRAAGLNDKTVKNSRKKFGVRTGKPGGPGTPWMWTIDADKGPDKGPHTNRAGTLGPLQVTGSSKGPKGPKVPTRNVQGPLGTLGSDDNVVVDFPAPAPAPFDAGDLDPIDAAILDALSPRRPQNKVQLKKSIPAATLNGVDLDGPIERLMNAGHITIADGGYLRATTTA